MATRRSPLRGNHTSMIEGARPVLAVLEGFSVRVAPGMIRADVGGRMRSVKIRVLNAETMELVIVAGICKQTLKVYGGDAPTVIRALKRLHKEGWKVQVVQVE